MKSITKASLILALLFIVIGAGTAQAQFFGFSVDTAVDYTVAPRGYGGTRNYINPFPAKFWYTQVDFKDETVDADEVNKS